MYVLLTYLNIRKSFKDILSISKIQTLLGSEKY